jgi:DNA modification methylase
MYFYPDNIQETILIFQKGKFDYKSIPDEMRGKSKIDILEYKDKKWYLNVWKIVNVLPLKNRLETGIAAFPEEIPYRLIKLFSYVGETVLDPFMGSGTTNKVAAMLKRNSVGYEIDLELLEVVKEKIGLKKNPIFYDVEIIVRDDAKHLRTELQNKVSNKISSVKNAKRISRRSNR